MYRSAAAEFGAMFRDAPLRYFAVYEEIGEFLRLIYSRSALHSQKTQSEYQCGDQLKSVRR